MAKIALDLFLRASASALDGLSHTSGTAALRATRSASLLTIPERSTPLVSVDRFTTRAPRLERRARGGVRTHADQGLAPARVTIQNRGLYVVAGDDGDLEAELAGRLRHQAGGGGTARGRRLGRAPPAPGGGRATIAAVLPRRTKLSRKVSERELEEQVLAANIDVIFLVTSLNRDLKLRRLERYLATSWESGASPVILLTKSDLADDVQARRSEVESIAFGVPIHVLSSHHRRGDRRAAALLRGPPYGGLPRLLWRRQVDADQRARGARSCRPLREIRESDDRGRHTTRRRELIVLPDGGIVIDTPGMRELQLWESEEGMDTAFSDVAELAAQCRFSDCSHEREPGCAIRRALEDGSLPRERWDSYRKLQRELRALEIKLDKRLQADERKKRRAFERQRRAPEEVVILGSLLRRASA